MSMHIATIISALFHAIAITAFAVWVGNYFSSSYIQKGFGSIEVELVVPGQEGLERGFLKADAEDLDLMRSSKTLRKERFVPPRVDSEEDMKEEQVQDGLEWRFQRKDFFNSSQKIKISSMAVRMPLDSGALMEIRGISKNPIPRYPRMAILKGWEGESVVRVFVDERGQVNRLAVIQSSGYSVLDDASLSGLRQWQFEKGRAQELEIPVKFILKSERQNL